MFNFYASLSLYFTALTSISLGIFAWIKNRKSPVNITFGLMSLAVFVWSISLALHLSILPMVILNRIANFASILIAITWLHFVMALTGQAKQKKKILILSYLAAFSMAIVTLLTNLSIVRLEDKIWFKDFAIAGPFYLFHTFLFTLLVTYGMFELYKAYKTSSGIKHQQIKYVLWGGLISFPLGITTYPLVFNIPVFPIGLYLTWLYVPITSYAVFRYHLFDVSIILRKSIVFSLLVVLVTSLYGTIVFGGQRFFQAELGLSEWAVALLASLVIALSFSPIKDLLARLTNKIFFKSQYNYQKTINQVSQAIASTIKLSELLSLLNKFLKQTVKVEKITLFLLDKHSGIYREEVFQPEKSLAKLIIIKPGSPLALHLLYTQKPIVAEELAQQIIYQEGSVGTLGQIARVKEELEKDNWALSVPLMLKQKLIGFLNLGPKLSQDIFSITDLRLLTTLANQTAVAIENASIYEKERRLSEAKSEFISVASHRLRTPLSVIKWALSLLKEDQASLSKGQRELVDKAFRSNDNMIKLINDLLNVSRIEESKYELKMMPTQLEDMLTEIISDFEPKITEKKLTLRFEEPKEPLPKIKVDAEKIKTALENVIYNAVIYTPLGGQIFVSLKLEKDKQSIFLTVKDTGIGIPQEKQDQVFDKFFRSQSAVAANTGGTGLGLFIAKSIIEDHSGEIWFESKEKQGTTFWIRLPI